MKKEQKDNKNLDKISEVSNTLNQMQNPLPGQNKRVSLGSVIVKPSQKSTIRGSMIVEESLEEKEKKIKQLQEAIIDKKERNDAIQEAFNRRQEGGCEEDHFLLPKLAAACATIMSLEPVLKKGLLKQLVHSLKQSKIKREKGVKMLLIWLISLLSKMFAFLSQVMKKK